MNEFTDKILTHIESVEAEQIRYGIFDVVLNGSDIFRAYSQTSESEVAQALQTLLQEGLILRFEDEQDIRAWVFRSRVAETVRLISKLRQRVVRSETDRKKHRADKSPSLVHDLKFEIIPRYVPNRNTPIGQVLTPIRSQFGQAAAILEKIFIETRFSGFQQRSFEAISEHILLRPQRGGVYGLVVTASTGAGKTLAFFLPVLANCIIHKGLNSEQGVKAICIYPRVALSENQLEDFVNLIYQVNRQLSPANAITVGIDSGASPYRLTDFSQPNHDGLQNIRGWQWDEQAGRYLCPFATCPVCHQKLAVDQIHPEKIYCISCGSEHPYLFYSKEQFLQTPPDILVATTESLNSRLMDSKYQMLFGNGVYPPPSVVMLDEIHLQSSTKGSQIALLLRRLSRRVRLSTQVYTGLPNLVIVGLSATIAQPKAFFSDLTGLTQSAITVVEPDRDAEMITIGAERYLFIRAEQEEDTAVISTLLQTAMAIVHNLQSPSAEERLEGLEKYKTFGFAQSLDIVGRWFYQLMDAEKMNPDNVNARVDQRVEDWPIEDTPLYWYRMPGDNRRLFPDFFGSKLAATDCDCQNNKHPELNCVYFDEGECWWTLNQGLPMPMRIKRKAASDRLVRIEPQDDLIITTSALEVGYDDPSIMSVIQYQSPTNVASFVQRKGRGGRKVGTRPMITTVLSPFKSTDIFLFQNHRLLVEPNFKKLPLNPQNPFLQNIHGFYALFDWLAYRASHQGIDLAFGDRMEEADYSSLLRLTANPLVFDEFRQYLAEVLGLEDPARLQDLLVDPLSQSYNNNGILSQAFFSLMEALHQAVERGERVHVEARRDILRDYLPQNLFSDVNLPELDVYYGQRNSANAEAIALGLTETIPGNVTFRGGGGGSNWILPKLGERAVFILDEAYTLSQDPRHQLPIDLREQPFPYRLSEVLQMRTQLPRTIMMYRPKSVRLENFGNRDGSRWWFSGSQKPGKLFPLDPAQIPDSYVVKRVRHASSAYPLSMTQIITPRSVGRRFAFDSRDGDPIYGDLARQLFRRIEFACDSDNGRLMKVQKVVVGSQYSLKLEGGDPPVEGIMTFARRDAPEELAAIGYEMQTEGITFLLTNFSADNKSITPEVAARLKRNFVKHGAVTQLSTWPDVNYFAADHFVEVLLTTADWIIHANGWTLDQTIAGCRADEKAFQDTFRAMAERVYHLSPKNRETVFELYARAEARSVFSEWYEDIHAERGRYHRYLEDTFIHTIKHALKQAAQTVAGVEAMEYVAAYTQLNMDFDQVADRPIWLYEIGMGGVGVIRSVQDTFRREPQRFWGLLEHAINTCETESEDRFLLDILSLPEAALSTIHQRVEALANTNTQTRQAVLEKLRTDLRQARMSTPGQDQVRLLVKMFSEDYTNKSLGLQNWQLYRELNIGWVNELSKKLGRLPTRIEARGLLFTFMNHSDPQKAAQTQQNYPELHRLLQLYKTEYTNDDIRRVFENALERRLLLNCRDACPTCLDEGIGCQVDKPGLGALTLSRALVKERISIIRQARTIQCAKGCNPAEMGDQAQKLFQHDLHSPIVLRASFSDADTISLVLSHLSDFGIVDRLEKRYPQVTFTQRNQDQLEVWLSLEEGKLR